MGNSPDFLRATMVEWSFVLRNGLASRRPLLESEQPLRVRILTGLITAHENHLHAFENRATVEGGLRTCQQGAAPAAMGGTGGSLAGVVLHHLVD